MNKMPKYDYKCLKCKEIFEVEKTMSADGPKKCLLCGAKSPERHFSEAPPRYYRDRPPWTYPEAKKYKTCRWNDGPRMKIDPSKHGDIGSWNSFGEILPPTKEDRIKKRKEILKKG
jgi:putative FmdB family regulatory protein